MQLYYPAQGSKRFATSAFPMVKSFRVDFGDSSASQVTKLCHFPKGTYVLGWYGVVREAFTSTGSAVLTSGFGVTTSASFSSSVIAKSTLVENYYVIPSSTYTATPKLYSTAATNFDIHLNTAKCSAGIIDYHIIYVPPPDGKIKDDDVFLSFSIT